MCQMFSQEEAKPGPMIVIEVWFRRMRHVLCAIDKHPSIIHIAWDITSLWQRDIVCCEMAFHRGDEVGETFWRAIKPFDYLRSMKRRQAA
jgi:hypothetical protein